MYETKDLPGHSDRPDWHIVLTVKLSISLLLPYMRIAGTVIVRDI